MVRVGLACRKAFAGLNNRCLFAAVNQPFLSAKLTKQFLLSLPKDSVLVSNVALTPGQPVFCEIVGDLTQRESQWGRIKAARVNHALCHAFRSPAEYVKHSLSVRYARIRN